MTMSTDEAILMTRRLAKEEGIFTGPSGGAAVAAALKVAREGTGPIVVFRAMGESVTSAPPFGRNNWNGVLTNGCDGAASGRAS